MQFIIPDDDKTRTLAENFYFAIRWNGGMYNGGMFRAVTTGFPTMASGCYRGGPPHGAGTKYLGPFVEIRTSGIKFLRQRVPPPTKRSEAPTSFWPRLPDDGMRPWERAHAGRTCSIEKDKPAPPVILLWKWSPYTRHLPCYEAVA